jgi:ankyrin repeat protein
MKLRSIFHQLFHFQISSLVIIAILALTWNAPAFCNKIDDVNRIHKAARDGQLKKLEVLLKRHPELVSSKDFDGNTPLHLAASNGHTDVAQLLFTNGAEINAQDNIGMTPLDMAAFAGHNDMVELLRQGGGRGSPGAKVIVGWIETVALTTITAKGQGNDRSYEQSSKASYVVVRCSDGHDYLLGYERPTVPGIGAIFESGRDHIYVIYGPVADIPPDKMTEEILLFKKLNDPTSGTVEDRDVSHTIVELAMRRIK